MLSSETLQKRTEAPKENFGPVRLELLQRQGLFGQGLGFSCAALLAPAPPPCTLRRLDQRFSHAPSLGPRALRARRGAPPDLL